VRSDGEALFRAICEEPWEDTPRLAYADWLEENGDPLRAAFIRHQVAVARGDEAAKQADRELMLTTFDGWPRRWGYDLPPLNGVKWLAYAEGFYDRGFVHSAQFNSAKAFHDHAAAVFAAAPVNMLTLLRVTPKTLAAVLASRHFRQIEAFFPHGRVGDDGVRAIARSPNLVNLTKVHLGHHEITDDAIEALAASECLPRLRGLRFAANQLGDRGALALLRSTTLVGLEEIYCGESPISEDVRRALGKRFRLLPH
jgi:uncharacterized protein (TIGR02996 family)